MYPFSFIKEKMAMLPLNSVEGDGIPGTEPEIKNFIYQCFQGKSDQATATFNLISI